MSIDKNTNEGKNYRNNVVKSTPGTSKSRINTGFPEDISVLSPKCDGEISVYPENRINTGNMRLNDS